MYLQKIIKSKLFYQLLPIIVCSILYIFFISSSHFMIDHLINPYGKEKILLHFRWFDVMVGFFLYFVTAIDYALIVGRMQSKNTGLTARFVMNVGTCLGCFVGVSIVLFLWGFAKEIDWLIVALLIFAGSVMVKLAHESIEYFETATTIWSPVRKITITIINFLHQLTHGLTFWIPELSSPKVEKISIVKLASWSFILPFIIGLDDFVGYMGAMTIYNVFSLLIGIYFADIFIDILIFISPKFTKKMVENAILSLLASYAFLYLTYKSYSEAILMILDSPDSLVHQIYPIALTLLVAILAGQYLHRHLKNQAR